jgi:ParB/RepB/Spo0J family partition protein
MKTSTNTINIEWHQLELRYQSLRIHTAGSIRRLMLSIHANGLLVPITVVASGVQERPWVVIDGYLRILALQALGEDLITANVWEIDAANALLYAWKHNKSRSWGVFEEANLLQELLTTHQHSQTEIARQLGKSETWVCHRLQFLMELPEFLKNARYQGTLSSWVASRILIPFARANSLHAEQFVNYLTVKTHTSREIRAFYEQYLRSNKKVRAELALNPSIFFKLQALNKLESTSDITLLPPEYIWEKKCDQIMDCLGILESVMSAAFYLQQPMPEQADLQQRFHQALARMNTLQLTLQRRNHEKTTDHTDSKRTTASG